MTNKRPCIICGNQTSQFNYLLNKPCKACKEKEQTNNGKN